MIIALALSMAAGEGTDFPNLVRAHTMLERVEKHYSQVVADQNEAMKALGPVPMSFDGNHSISGGSPIKESKAQKFYLSVLSNELFLRARTGPIPLTMPSFADGNATLEGEHFKIHCKYGYPLQKFSEQITCVSPVKRVDEAGLHQWTAITYFFSDGKISEIAVASNVPAIREKGVSLVKKKQNG